MNLKGAKKGVPKLFVDLRTSSLLEIADTDGNHLQDPPLVGGYNPAFQLQFPPRDSWHDEMWSLPTQNDHFGW